MKNWIIDRIDSITTRAAVWAGRDMNLMRAIMWVAGAGLILAIATGVMLLGAVIAAVWRWAL